MNMFLNLGIILYNKTDPKIDMNKFINKRIVCDRSSSLAILYKRRWSVIFKRTIYNIYFFDYQIFLRTVLKNNFIS
jgi:hypothetical protein